MKKLSILIGFVFLVLIQSFSQNLTQTVRGAITDNDSKQPLIGVTVVIPGTYPLIGTTSDIDGNFRLGNLPIGRITLQFTYIGYEPVSLPNIEVNSGKEVVLNISMQESVVKLGEVIVKAEGRKGETINEMVQLSSHSITLEETKRFTGGMDDPARVVSCFAGASSTPGGSSDIIVRGNSPKYMQWRMDGTEITSPYHMEDQNSSMGALTALNNKLLATSDFHTGAFSAEYGDVLSGVYDVKLRTGNNEKFEATAGLGLMGTDLTLEGPLKKGYSGSYLLNYRYSTISLMNDLGLVEVPGAVNYQDATFKVVIPTKKAGIFSIYGLGGKSGVNMENIGPSGLSTPGSPSSSSLISKDYIKSNYLANIGLSHTMLLNEHSHLKTTLNYSGTGSKDEIYESDSLQSYNNGEIIMADSALPRNHTISSSSDNLAIRGTVTYNTKINAKNRLQVGSRYTLGGFDSKQEMYSRLTGSMNCMNDINVYLSTLNNFISWKHSFSEHISFVAGLHNMNVLNHRESTLEPRFSLNWNLGATSTLFAGYGSHSNRERIHNYYTRIKLEDGTHIEPNRNLDLLKAHHLVFGYKKYFSRTFMGKIEAYYQYLYDLPVENDPNSSYCTINEGIDYNYVELVNEGTGRNYGIEISVEKFFDKQYYFLVNASLFNSEYNALDNVWRSTRYNNNYIVNILGGKEFKDLGRKNNQVLALNMKILFEGGQRYIPLLRDENGNVAVEIENGKYYDFSRAYYNQLDDIFTMNLSVSYKFNRPHATHELFLDLLNVTNSQDKLSEYFDPAKPGNIGYTTQFPFMPNVMYRVYF